MTDKEALAQKEIDFQKESLTSNRASSAPAAETPPPTSAPGGLAVPAADAVRVRRVTGDAPVFAICQPDERLIGGGCEPSGVAIATDWRGGSYPTHYSESDTRGARWQCTGRGSYTAYALCQPIALRDVPSGSTSLRTERSE